MKVEQAFINQLEKHGVMLTDEQHESHVNDFKLYCEEMAFTTEEEIIAGASEYVTCQIHYGIFR